MAVRLIINITAVEGTGSELAAAYRERCEDVQREPGCIQFELFQSTLNPDKMVILEHWESEEALAVHSQLNTTRPSIRPELRAGAAAREDYTYNRTR